jgi:hypothetical protein
MEILLSTSFPSPLPLSHIHSFPIPPLSLYKDEQDELEEERKGEEEKEEKEKKKTKGRSGTLPSIKCIKLFVSISIFGELKRISHFLEIIPQP